MCNIISDMFVCACPLTCVLEYDSYVKKRIPAGTRDMTNATRCLMGSLRTDVESQLSSGPVLVRESETARFRWQVPAVPGFTLLYVISPSGAAVLLANILNNHQTVGSYTTRVTYTGNLTADPKAMAFDLRSVVRSDAGDYTCGNDGVTDILPQCGQKLVVLGQPTKPTLNGPSAPVFGTQVTLTCSSTSTTVPADHGQTLTYTWQRDNTDIPLTYPGSPYTFTVSSRDSHSYRCRARESQGLESEWSQGYNMEPQYGPYAVTLQPSTLSYTRREGQERVPSILCSDTCRPACTYKWFKDGTVHSDGETLTLPVADRSQTGSYKCQASNIHGTNDSSSVSVDVTYVPVVTLSPTCQPHTVYVGQPNAQLICQVTAANPPVTSYIWTHNGSPIPSATSREYSLSPVSRSSGGSYTCAGRNSVGTSNVSAVTVEVQYKPSVSVPQSTSVRESQTLNRSCSVDANPAAAVRWTKKDDSSFTPQTGSTLTISNIQRSQAGTYVCTATNTLSPCGGTALPRSESREMTVDVQYPANITSFSINTGENRVTVNESDPVTLKCQVASNPKSSIILYNGSVEISRADNSETDDHGVTHAACRQRGNYSCTADNNLGSGGQRREVELLVRCSPRYDESYPVQDRYASATGSDVSLSVNILSYPGPTITWSRTNITTQRNLTSSSSLTRVSDLTVTSTLTLTNLKEEDFGEYQVYVNNGVVQAVEYSITLDPKGPPSPPTHVTVTPSGPSSLQVSWTKGFNGGDTQTFMVEYSTDDATWREAGMYVENREQKYQTNITGLQSQTVYYVRVYAENINGKSHHTKSVQGLTKEEEHIDTGTSTAMIAGAAAGSIAALLLLVLVAVLVIRYKRKTTEDDTEKIASNDKGRKTNEDDRLEMRNDIYESADKDEAVMQENVCYSSSGEVQAGAVSDVHAVADKTKPHLASDHSEVYAAVQKLGKKQQDKKDGAKGKYKKQVKGKEEKKDKSKNKGDKAHLKSKKRDGRKGDVYENTGVSGEGNPYINYAFDDQSEATGNREPVSEGAKSGKDEDGCVYVGIDFSGHNPSPQVHREEESTEYAGIQFGVVGQLPEDEEKEKNTP